MPRTITAALAEALRRARADRRQEEVAASARQLGLAWTQATVAALETEKRSLSIDELLLVPALYGCALSELFTGNEVLSVGDGSISTADARAVLSGEVRTYDDLRQHFASYTDISNMARVAGRERIKLRWPELLKADDEARAAVLNSIDGEAERKAARRLGVTPEVVAFTAFALWHRTLTDEREARLNIENATTGRSRQAARGHITRALLAELEPIIKQRLRRKRGKR